MILVLTGEYVGRRMQFAGDETQDMHFESVIEALKYAESTVEEMENQDNELPANPMAHVIDTKDDRIHTYRLEIQPKRYFFRAA